MLGSYWDLAELSQLMMASSEKNSLTDEGFKHFFFIGETFNLTLYCVSSNIPITVFITKNNRLPGCLNLKILNNKCKFHTRVKTMKKFCFIGVGN